MWEKCPSTYRALELHQPTAMTSANVWYAICFFLSTNKVGRPIDILAMQCNMNRSFRPDLTPITLAVRITALTPPSPLPSLQCGVTALTWGHNGRRLFVATGAVVHVAWVGRRVAPLQLICRLSIKDALGSEEATAQLPLPRRVKLQLAGLFSPTLRVNGASTA